MIDPEMRKAIYRLHQKGMGVRQISRSLGVCRNAVRSIIKQNGEMPLSVRGDKIELDKELLTKLYEECDGYRERIFEKLTEEGVGEEKKKYEIAYPTLTRRLRELGIGTSGSRCDRVADKPGAEMQQDTSPYQVLLGNTRTRVIASILYLRYSKRRYLKFYRRFNRFVMKCFLHEGLTFWGYSAPLSVIDNTNLARLRGTGKDAVMVPEMESFAKRYGFHFECHALLHPNRKAGNERSFFTVETNFFPGRSFESLEDLNQQAFQWATVKMENKAVGKSKVIPAKAFEHERSYLIKLPPYLPAPYLPLKRWIDQYGYVAVDANFYWVPGEDRAEVPVLKYDDCVKIYQNRKLVAEYRLAADGVTNQCFSPEGYPKPRHKPNNRKKPTAEEEKRLRAMGDVVGTYLDFALKLKGPQKRHQFIRELFRLARQMTPARLCRAVKRALKYQITAVVTIRRIVFLQLGEEGAIPPLVDVDRSFEQREAYLEGRLSDAPNFSSYDDLLKEDDDG